MDIERAAQKWVKTKWSKLIGRSPQRCYADGEFFITHDGFDLRFMVLMFDAVCALTGTVSYENAYLTVKIMRDIKR